MPIKGKNVEGSIKKDKIEGKKWLKTCSKYQTNNKCIGKKRGGIFEKQ